jgi:hypothetical protein
MLGILALSAILRADQDWRIHLPTRLGTPVGIGGNKPPRSPVLSIRRKHLIHPPHRIGDLKMKYLILAAFAALPAAIAPVANAASTIAGHAQATRLQQTGSYSQEIEASVSAEKIATLARLLSN